jgi:hypothetical protein
LGEIILHTTNSLTIVFIVDYFKSRKLTKKWLMLEKVPQKEEEEDSVVEEEEGE